MIDFQLAAAWTVTCLWHCEAHLVPLKQGCGPPLVYNPSGLLAGSTPARQPSGYAMSKMTNRMKKAEKAKGLDGNHEHPNLAILHRPMSEGAVIFLGERTAALLGTEPGMYEKTKDGLKLVLAVADYEQ